ncbi:hypothetical protein CROQUDRAFT_664576 [Cronartium quercuum f. sp. fusiforme G11]|uniref:Expansin-like EG45 domain-containing protein n=1 Tax=Cronartium quercuum f. sp. fusiforme G11 TaxID=708437 RepID=A0A9P6T7X4_9BASI|nr:hypothetical protein CROQUDRAFT_664576 [Cronartium quercuum f. sp. fusiforme G11]
MKYTILIALGTFSLITCLPSHFNHIRSGHNFATHQRLARSTPRSMDQQHDDDFQMMVKRSTSSDFDQIEADFDRILVARSEEDDSIDDCDEDDEDENDEDNQNDGTGSVVDSQINSSLASFNSSDPSIQKNSSTETKPQTGEDKSADSKSTYTKPVENVVKPDETKSKSPSSGTSVSVSANVTGGSSEDGTSTSGGGSNVYNGKATFFYQGGAAGACGTVHLDSDYVVAIQSSLYDNGKYCGKKIRVTRTSTGQSVTCVGADECPSCSSASSLDLSVAAFNALGKPDEGLFDIKWEVVS